MFLFQNFLPNVAVLDIFVLHVFWHNLNHFAYRPAIVVLLMSMVNEKQPFYLRCAVLYCFQSFLYKNELGQSQIIQTLLPSTADGECKSWYSQSLEVLYASLVIQLSFIILSFSKNSRTTCRVVFINIFVFVWRFCTTLAIYISTEISCVYFLQKPHNSVRFQ